MSLTVEEAKDRMCPFKVKSWCIGDTCMAWKWTKFKETSRRVVVQSDVDHLYRHGYDMKREPSHGICKLIFKSK